MKAEFHFDGEPVAFALSASEPATIPATKQDIFDRVVRHYRKHPKQCHHQGQCRYWIEGGERCFVGALMSEVESKASPAFSIGHLIERGRAPEWMVPHKEFLADIQKLHDTPTNWAEGIMPMVLEMLAAERGLVMPD